MIVILWDYKCIYLIIMMKYLHLYLLKYEQEVHWYEQVVF